MLFVSDVHNHPGAANFEAAARNYWPEKPPRILSYTLAAWADRIRIPVGADLAGASPRRSSPDSGKTLEELARAAETPRGFAAVAAAGRAGDVRTAVDRHIVPDRNVVALLEGSDPRLKNEWVIVSAHYDHNGADAHADLQRRRRQRIGRGRADRDRRGLRARGEGGSPAEAQHPVRVVELGGARSARRVGLHRAAARAAEHHRGGAEHGHDRPQRGDSGRRRRAVRRPRGADRRVEQQRAEPDGVLEGAGHHRGRRTARTAAIGLELKKRYDNNSSNLLRRSDQWPFLQRGVPAMGFITGLHPDYHTTYDRPEKINYVKMEKIARLVHQVSWDIANADARPKAPATRSTNRRHDAVDAIRGGYNPRVKASAFRARSFTAAPPGTLDLVDAFVFFGLRSGSRPVRFFTASPRVSSAVMPPEPAAFHGDLGVCRPLLRRVLHRHRLRAREPDAAGVEEAVVRVRDYFGVVAYFVMTWCRRAAVERGERIDHSRCHRRRHDQRHADPHVRRRLPAAYFASRCRSCWLCSGLGLYQNIAIVFSGNPVPPVTGIGLIVSMNSQRFSLAAVSPSASRSWLSSRLMPSAGDHQRVNRQRDALRPSTASRPRPRRCRATPRRAP